MIIRVIYQNGQVGTVLPEKLDTLIDNRQIYSFKRSDGWVNVHQGPLRKRRGADPTDPEQRSDRRAADAPD